MSEHRVATTEDIVEGRGIAIDIGDRRIAVFRYEGEYFALDETCPHRGGPLHEGTIESGVLMCPWHQWQFELESGCSPVNPMSRVKRYQVRVEGEAVWIEVPEDRETGRR